MDAVALPPRLPRWLLHPIAAIPYPMLLNIVRIPNGVLPPGLFIGRSNSLPAQLAVRQYLIDYTNEQRIFCNFWLPSGMAL